MGTTLLFVELLITGVQASVWLVLVGVNIYGFGWFQALSTLLKEWQTPAAIVVLSFIYVLGIAVDRVADGVFSKLDIRIKDKEISNKNGLSVSVMRWTKGPCNEALEGHFQYMRSRIRVARASVVNLALITLLSVHAISNWVPPSSGQCAYIIQVFFLGLALVFATLFAWWKLEQSYYHLVQLHYDNGPHGNSPGLKRELL